MSKLTSAARNKIPTKKFGDPQDRKYPIENRSHAIDAKARAKEMLDAGRLTQAKYNEIISRADRGLDE
jgi:hypothetical protein